MSPDSLEPIAVSVIFVTLIVSVAGVLRHGLRVRQQRLLADLRVWACAKRVYGSSCCERAAVSPEFSRARGSDRRC
ncbi:MAG TPA: hypothetical protein VMT85_14595 [Thermoanaerobaculia bacterium]|nr:hypothetical protein [Thermoanaerobaculia bacterium]